MSSTLAVEKGLPPGLWLPTAHESTEQYRSEVFNHSNHPYEDIIDYGAFAVALIVLDSPRTERVSYMPSQKDIDKLFGAGYGISRPRLGSEYGGVARLQQALGWYPKGYRPPKEELITRLKWMASYALDPETDLDRSTVDEVLRWGAQRDLLPSSPVSYKILGDTIGNVRKIFAIEKPNSPKQYTFSDVYRFGALVLKDNATPPTDIELDRHYGDYFHAKPDQAIRAFFGTTTKFWLEFGLLTKVPQLDQELVRNFGIRYAIENDGQAPNKPIVEKMSELRTFPSALAIARNFGGIINYQQVVQEGYQEYLKLHGELVEQGVTEEVVRLVCRKYEAGEAFSGHLKDHASTMAKVSMPTSGARYVRRLITSGLDLEDQDIYDMQLEDLLHAFRRTGIKRDATHFALELVPRINVDEVLNRAPFYNDLKAA
jgi:hypothetical protein